MEYNEIRGGMDVMPCFIEDAGSLNGFVLGDHVFWLGRRQTVRLSLSGGCFRGKNVFFEEVEELFMLFWRLQ